MISAAVWIVCSWCPRFVDTQEVCSTRVVRRRKNFCRRMYSAWGNDASPVRCWTELTATTVGDELNVCREILRCLARQWLVCQASDYVVGREASATGWSHEGWWLVAGSVRLDKDEAGIRSLCWADKRQDVDKTHCKGHNMQLHCMALVTGHSSGHSPVNQRYNRPASCCSQAYSDQRQRPLSS